jgi:formylglycine-generating enzyme required for sulfatase activity
VIVDPEEGIQVINFALPADILKEAKTKSVYLSPEERNGRSVDDKSDEYSLAVMAYELLAGSLPFEPHDTDATPLPIPGVSSAVDAVIHRAMSRDRDDRYETCQAFVSALEKESQNSKQSPGKPVVITPNNGTKTSSGQTSAASQGSASRWLWVGSLIVLLLAMGVAAVWYLTQNSATPPAKPPVNQAAKQPTPPPAAVDEAEAKAEQERKAAEAKAAEEAAQATQKKEAEARVATEQAEREQKEAEKKLAAEQAAVEVERERKEAEEKLAAKKATAETERKQKEAEEKAAAVKAREVTKQERETAKKAATEGDLKAHNAGELFALPIDGVEYRFRWCPPGEFVMGSPESEIGHFDLDPNYKETQHKVTLTRGFWMLETEVTQEMWEMMMGKNPSEFRGQKDCPVECVSWNDCRDFVAKLNERKSAPAGYRFSLPTEAQWEYACRAGTVTPFSFGETLNGDAANSGGMPYPNGIGPSRNFGKTARVRSYLPNPWGFYDMHGNVCEWCLDWGGTYSNESVTDPAGPSYGAYRIRRGGAWGRNAVFCRSADRRWDDSSVRNSRLGLRLAIVVE